MWRSATKSRTVNDAISDQVTRARAVASDADMPARDEVAFEFEFNFSSLSRPFQRTLLALHDDMRKRINRVYAVRRELEHMVRDFNAFRETGKWPRFTEKISIHDRVQNEPVPLDVDPQRRTFKAFASAVDQHDVGNRADLAIAAKAAEIEVVKGEAGISDYRSRANQLLDNVFEELCAMDFHTDVDVEVWRGETLKFVASSFEFLVFGKALHESVAKKLREAREQEEATARTLFQELKPENQLDLMIDAKIGRRSVGGKKLTMKQLMHAPALQKMSEDRADFMKSSKLERTVFDIVNGSLDDGKGRSSGKGGRSLSRSNSRGREPPTKGKGKGKKNTTKGKSGGKGKKKRGSLSRGPSKGRQKGKSKGKGGKAKKGKSPSRNSWTSWSSAQDQWQQGSRQRGASRGGWKGSGKGARRWQ